MVNDFLTMIYLPWSIDRYRYFCHGFFEICGGRVYSTTKICTVVDGIRPTIKMMTPSELTCGNRHLQAGHVVIFSTTAINPWQMAGPLKVY
jgi:hypothetical protein